MGVASDPDAHSRLRISMACQWTTTFEFKKNNNSKVLLFYIIRVRRERGGVRIRQGTGENTAQPPSLKLFFLTSHPLQKHFLTCIVHPN